MLATGDIQLSKKPSMKRLLKAINNLSFITLYRLQWIAIISLVWTAIQLLLYFRGFYSELRFDYPYTENIFSAYILRAAIFLCLSAIMAYLLLVEWTVRFRNISLLAGWVIKTFILLVIAGLGTSVVFIAHFMGIKDQDFASAISELNYFFFHTGFFVDSLFSWIVIILVTEVLIEVDQKYSPGVFWQIITGKYLSPRTETRIIMFLDLKDSTPIAETLGHEKYFSFIKDFIYYVSSSVLDNGGHIHQYVGDEIVVTWPYRRSNIQKSVNTVILARRTLQHASDYFRRKYDMSPEFKVGMHIGEVTIGEIGVMKKDIAISGDAMNIAARIRTACGELNQKFIVSQEYFESNVLKSWQGENLGEITLKGVEKPIQLYALKI
jgi:adenylate cyclase